MTGTSPVTTILSTTARLCHAKPCIVVTGLAPVMFPTTGHAIIGSAILMLMRMGVVNESPYIRFFLKNLLAILPFTLRGFL